MIRSFITRYFETVLNVIVVLSAVGVVIGSLSTAINAGGFVGIVAFFACLIMGSCSLILVFGVVYTLLDINHKLTVLADARDKP